MIRHSVIQHCGYFISQIASYRDTRLFGNTSHYYVTLTLNGPFSGPSDQVHLPLDAEGGAPHGLLCAQYLL